MKKSIIILLLAFFTLILFGCGRNPVHDDLLNYVNEEIPKITDLENTVISKYDSVSGKNYTNDQTMYYALRTEIIPASLDLIDAAEGIVPKTDEVKEAHEKYISALNKQNSGFTIILSAIETQDYQKISLANEKLDTARKEMREYISAINKLAEENGVELSNKE